MKSLPLLLITGSLALFAAGCGGDDEKDTESAARGYDETGQALDDICTRAEAEVDPLSTKGTGEAAADAELLRQIADINAKYIAEVKAIEPDSKLEATYDEFVTNLDQLQAKTLEAAEAGEADDQEAYEQSAAGVADLDKENDRLAIALGAPACATD